MKIQDPPISGVKLNFNVDENVENNDETEGINYFAALNKDKSFERNRVVSVTQYTEDPCFHPIAANFEQPIDSENLVEWRSDSQQQKSVAKLFCFSLLKDPVI